MKQIGREALFIHAGDGNPRNGESTFIRLNDGRIMMAFTEYYGVSGEDHGTARISAVCSPDEGESWSDPFVLLEKDEKAENYMSPSLVRMNNGDLGMMYLRKEKMPDNGIICVPAFRRSADEGESWSEPVKCAPDGYYCTVNDSARRLRSGRIISPTCYYGLRYDAYGNCTLDLSGREATYVVFVCSDDDGKTWDILPSVLKTPYTDKVGLAEPGIYEHEDGTLWCWFRTGYGFQYHSHSYDGGKTWDPVEPNFRFTSPDSPMAVKNVGSVAVAVFNPVGYNCLRQDTETWGSPKRTPIVCAVSADDGHSLGDRGVTSVNAGLKEFVKGCYLLETDTENSYCYPALCETKDGFLAAYYHSDGTQHCLRSTKIVKVSFSELENIK